MSTHGRRGGSPSGELRRIDWIRRRLERLAAPGAILGAGDDAAIWRPATGRDLALTVDAQVEGVHFRLDWMSPREAGRRAVETSLSDLAALAATPACLLVAITTPRGLPDRIFRALYEGILDGARAAGAGIAGGNLSEGPLSVTVTSLGTGKPKGLLRRSGARPLDEIWVTGSPGLARLGRLALARGIAARLLRSKPPVRRAAALAIRAYRSPRARLRESLAIARAWRPTAMIDLSDGLSGDIAHVLRESARKSTRSLGATFHGLSLESLESLNVLAEAMGEDPVRSALEGGDDYELCFTAPPSGDAATRRRAAQKLGVNVTPVGCIDERRGIRLQDAGSGRVRRIEPSGWEHA